MKYSRFSLRQTLDLASGILLVTLALAGCIALGLAARQRSDTQLLLALHNQERLADRLVRLGDEAAASKIQRHETDTKRLSELRELQRRLKANLETLRSGGQLPLDGAQSLSVKALRDPIMLGQLSSAMQLIDKHDLFLRDFVERSSRLDATSLLRSQAQLRGVGKALAMLIRGLSSGSERQSLAVVLNTSRLQLALMSFGLLVFLMGVLMLRRLVTTPLHRMADCIHSMHQMGRLTKVPVLHDNELGVVASGFNQLTDQVETQKRKLREHIIELQRVNDELDRLAHVKDDFLATIGHQFRTPLTAIVEGVELLREGSLGPVSRDQLSMLKLMQENAARLTHTIEEALDLSLIKSGRRPLHREPAALVPLLQKSQKEWEAGKYNRRVRLECDALANVVMDCQAIEDVMGQLLRNAMRHAPENSEVVISARSIDDFAEVSVKDEGPGLSPEQMKKLFQPFVHLNNPEAPGSQGGGLGLAFCRQLIEQHRGSIRVESCLGKGTTLSFALPFATPQFLFEDACYNAREQAERGSGEYAVLLAGPEASDDKQLSEVVSKAEAILRARTHRGDRFVRMDGGLLVAIVAVTDQPGLNAMMGRLRELIRQQQLKVRLSAAVFPVDGEEAQQLLAAAKARFSEHAAQSCTKIHPGATSRSGISVG